MLVYSSLPERQPQHGVWRTAQPHTIHTARHSASGSSSGALNSFPTVPPTTEPTPSRILWAFILRHTNDRDVTARALRTVICINRQPSLPSLQPCREQLLACIRSSGLQMMFPKAPWQQVELRGASKEGRGHALLPRQCCTPLPYSTPALGLGPSSSVTKSCFLGACTVAQ